MRWASAAPGDLYVVESPGVISKFTPAGTKSTFASGLSTPYGLAFDRTGNLYVSEVERPGTIKKLTPEGVESTFATTEGYPLSLAFDGAGNLLVEESFGDPGDILKITPEGTKSTFVGGQYFRDLTFDRLGNLFAGSGGPTNLYGGIVWYSPDGTLHDFFISEDGALAFDAAGNLFVGSSDDEIVKYTPLPAAERSVFATAVGGASDFAFDASGNLYASNSENGTILRFAPDGSRSTFASGLTGPTSLAFEPVTEKLRNISARGLVGTGDDVLIGGFIVGGNALANNAIVVRAIGPSLTAAAVSNALADPALELHDASGALILSNDDWQDTQEEQIAATGLAPTDPKEAAIFATLPAGNYTAVVRGAGDTTGTALVEIYSAGQ